MVIALAAYVHGALAAQEDAVGLHAGLHGAGAKVAEFLALGLAVVDGGFERWQVKRLGDRWQALKKQRGQHHPPCTP